MSATGGDPPRARPSLPEDCSRPRFPLLCRSLRSLTRVRARHLHAAYVGAPFESDDKAVQSRYALCALARSEEHTSELQSLMRISYAVFCLNKKHIEHAINNARFHTGPAHTTWTRTPTK